MTMRARAFAATAAAAVVLAGGGAVAAVAATSAAPPAGQPGSTYVYACVNPAGKIDYLEFRDVPHPCWYAGESLWSWPARTPVTPPASPSPTATS
jgi:hypothetical protein